ncbi:UNVERIFIED_CONTAM: hypothetical protein Sangu_2170200 [Sesamum angustifolium]|uniref:Uncharacterized protein n=1 Tax=Sesamum angustifolium TaxID=2727405 RepID=A0AAW2LGJ4_9LAMI
MRYWLTILGFISAIDDNIELNSWHTREEVDYHCHNRILSALSERLYDVFCTYANAKELWNALVTEYEIDDSGIQRFNASTFMKYTMVDGKSINEQIHEFQDLLRPLEESGSKFIENYKVSCLIDKLPPSWSNFARGLRHQQGVLTLTQAFKSLRIEEQHRMNVKQDEMKVKVNIVEDKRNYNQKNFKPRGMRKAKKRKKRCALYVEGLIIWLRIARKTRKNASKFNSKPKNQHGQVHMLVEESPSVRTQVEEA